MSVASTREPVFAEPFRQLEALLHLENYYSSDLEEAANARLRITPLPAFIRCQILLFARIIRLKERLHTWIWTRTYREPPSTAECSFGNRDRTG